MHVVHIKYLEMQLFFRFMKTLTGKMKFHVSLHSLSVQLLS